MAAPGDGERSSRGPVDRETRAAVLKERIYLTFAALAVVLTLGSHGVPTAIQSLTTLAVTVLGTLLAVFTADVVSHLVVHERVPTRAELQHILAATFGALGAVLLPFVLLALAALGVWETQTALRASSVALIAALVVIGFLAVRRTSLSPWQRIAVLGAEAALGLAVIGLQTLSHG